MRHILGWEQDCLVREMNFRYSLVEKPKNNFLISFLDKNNFIYVDFHAAVLLDEPVIMVFSEDCDTFQDAEFKKQLNKSKNKAILFLPKKLNFINYFSDFNKIFYPLPISKLEKLLRKSMVEKNFSFKDIFLYKESFLCNKSNQKKIYLTETEINILKLLFREKIVNKETLKNDILKQKSSILTKSLESHLSRIRKKINDIDSKTLIISSDKLHITIL